MKSSKIPLKEYWQKGTILERDQPAIVINPLPVFINSSGKIMSYSRSKIRQYALI